MSDLIWELENSREVWQKFKVNLKKNWGNYWRIKENFMRIRGNLSWEFVLRNYVKTSIKFCKKNWEKCEKRLKENRWKIYVKRTYDFEEIFRELRGKFSDFSKILGPKLGARLRGRGALFRRAFRSWKGDSKLFSRPVHEGASVKIAAALFIICVDFSLGYSFITIFVPVHPLDAFPDIRGCRKMSNFLPNFSRVCDPVDVEEKKSKMGAN